MAKSVKFSAPVSARVTFAPGTVTALIVLPVAKGMAAQQRAERDALIAAHAYRLAAEICMLNADVGACIAIDTLNAYDGRVTLEMAEGQDETVVQALMADALQFERIATTYA